MRRPRKKCARPPSGTSRGGRALVSEMLAAVDAGIQRILRDPKRFSLLETLPPEEGVRRLLLKRFPFSIVYEIGDEEVQILAVAHGRRRPGYWKGRG